MTWTSLDDVLAAAWRRFRFWLRCRQSGPWRASRWTRDPRCGCGQYRLSPPSGMKLGDVKHQTVGPCYPCDDRGEPEPR